MRPRYTPVLAAVAATGILSLMVVLQADAGPTVAAVKTVTVVAGKPPSEFKFTLSVKSVPHGKVLFKLTDKGNLPHDLKICSSPLGGNKNTCRGKGSKLITPGTSTSFFVTFKVKGSYEYLCTVAGHAAAGMKGILKVT